MTTTLPSIIPLWETDSAVQEFDYAVEIVRDPSLKSPKTKRQYKVVLMAFAGWKRDRQFNKTLVEEYASELQGRSASPSTIKQFLAVIKWWSRRITDLAYEQLPRAQADEISNQAARILSIREKDIAKGTRLSPGRHVPPEDLAALVSACLKDPSPAGARDAAWICVSIPTGARASEILDLTIDDLKYTEEGAEVTIQHGKGDKARKVFLFGNSLLAMDEWLNRRGVEAGPLFCKIRKDGKIIKERMSYEASRLILIKRFKQSSIAESIRWHDFRRTLAGTMFDMGLDAGTIQNQFGHASIETTKKYDRRPEDRRKAAIKEIEVPYHPITD